MGGLSSKDDGFAFAHREELVRWALDSVKDAFKRYHALKGRHAGPTQFLLTRREYFEVFNDYTVITADGGFLSLSMDIFDQFLPKRHNAGHGDQKSGSARGSDLHGSKRRHGGGGGAAAGAGAAADGAGAGDGRTRSHVSKASAAGFEYVFAPELFVALALFCNGVLDEKISFVYSIFDITKPGELVMPDMVLLLQSLTNACHKLEITKRVPSTKQLTDLAKEMFGQADLNKDATLTSSEFAMWAHNNISSKKLLTRFQGETEKAKNAYSRHTATAGARRRRHSRPHVHTAEEIAARKAARAERLGSEEAKKEEARLERAARGKPKEKHYYDDILRGVEVKEKRQRYEKLRWIANKKLMLELFRSTSFSKADLKNVAEAFTDASNTAGRLSRDAFGGALKKHFPEIARDEHMLNRLYAVTDTDGDGFVNFKEWVMGLAKCMAGTISEKIELMFSLYDDDGSGSMDVTELMTVIGDALTEHTDGIDFVVDVVDALEVEGEVECEDFVRVLTSDPHLQTTFCSSTMATETAAVNLHRWHARCEGATHENFDKMWAVMKVDKRQLQNTVVTQTYMRSFMATHFNCVGEQDVHDVGQLFAAMWDGDEDHHLLLREVIVVLAQVFLDVQGFLRVYFEMWDINNSGTLSREELTLLLLHSQEESDRGTLAVLHALNKIDLDGDGRISVDEFKSMATHDRNISEVLGRLFGVSGRSFLAKKRF